MTIAQRPWWKDAVVYQIYPASFQDSNNDGIGDIRGIINRLDYIRSIGIDVIWICPMYQSPQVDMGYDISDYQAVHKPYGTLEDMEELIRETHKRDMKIILDLVVNHTSDQHHWFQESRASKHNPKRDWYIWRPATYDSNGQRQPPNNWRSFFGGSVWQWDDETEEYYLHLFCPEQPDLNWENPDTRRAIYEEAMIFWLDKDVDGFRIDTVNMYSKPEGLPNAPVTESSTEWQDASLVFCNGPQMKQYLSEMNSILSRYDAMTVGECPATPDRSTVISYISAAQKRLNMVFQFDVVDVGVGEKFRYQTVPFAYTLPDFKRAIAKTQSLLDSTDAWTTSFIENHDQARSISRFGNDSPQWRVLSGKTLSLLFACLSGTLFIYQGQEIGMVNAPESWPIEEYKDVDSSNYYNMVAKQTNYDRCKLAEAKAAIAYLSRDHARTPMQWDSSQQGGFTDESVTPWMRVNPSTATINVTQQANDKASVLAFWKKLLQIRHEYRDVLVDACCEVTDMANESVFTLIKHGTDRKAFVVCNFSTIPSERPRFPDGKVVHVIGNMIPEKGCVLRPWEAHMYLIN